MQDKDLNQNGEYSPRPTWQIWAARAALVIMIIGIIGWLYNIANPL